MTDLDLYGLGSRTPVSLGGDAASELVAEGSLSAGIPEHGSESRDALRALREHRELDLREARRGEERERSRGRREP